MWRGNIDWQFGTRHFGTRTIGQQELKADNSATTWQNGQFGIKYLICLDWTTYNSHQHLEQSLSFGLFVCQRHIEEIMLSNHYFDVFLLGAKLFVSLCLYQIVCCQIVYFLILVPICLFVSLIPNCLLVLSWRQIIGCQIVCLFYLDAKLPGPKLSYQM